jgi:predicted molibdopterin-dependent oxidoreductase YjgC
VKYHFSVDKVTLTIDGRQLSVPKGITVLQAAIEAGIKVPYYAITPVSASTRRAASAWSRS